MVRSVRQSVSIPLAVKLSPFYTSFANVAKTLDEVGANGLVLFNRFYQPDIDVDNLEVVSNLQLSTSAELPLRLRWLAIVSGRVRASLGVTGEREGSSGSLEALTSRIREASGVPIVAGVGISTPEQAASAASHADGVIVGSALVRRVLEAENPMAAAAVLGAAVTSLGTSVRR
jgi:dihydroorotate dehydrogenase (fumarate)